MERDRTGSPAVPSWPARPVGGSDRHTAAAARTLSWADESAERGDYADALAWLRTLEAAGDQLSPEYAAKCERWRRAAAADSPARPCVAGR